MVASEAAHATGFPPNVDAWLPLGQSITEARATIAPSGSPLAIPLARHTMSPATPQCSEANILPVRPIPLCTSSKTSSTPCSSHSSPQTGKELRRRHDVAPLPLDRLDEDRRQLIGRTDRAQQARTLSRSPYRAW